MHTSFQYGLARWCFNLFGPKWSTEQLCEVAQRQGCVSIDLAEQSEWQTIKNSGLQINCLLPDMGPNIPPFGPGLCDSNHAVRHHVSSAIKTAIHDACIHHVPFVLVFTGCQVDGISHEQAMENCVRLDGFPDLVSYAAEFNVRLVLEALNTTEDPATWRGHPGYYGSRFDFCSDIVYRTNLAIKGQVARRNFGMVLDCYHQSVMGEDVWSIIAKHHSIIDYIHLAGVYGAAARVPNRSELHRAGQKIDFKTISDILLKKHKLGMPVLLEYIPTNARQAAANIRRAIRTFEP